MIDPQPQENKLDLDDVVATHKFFQKNCLNGEFVVRYREGIVMELVPTPVLRKKNQAISLYQKDLAIIMNHDKT